LPFWFTLRLELRLEIFKAQGHDRLQVIVEELAQSILRDEFADGDAERMLKSQRAQSRPQTGQVQSASRPMLIHCPGLVIVRTGLAGMQG
jgi:hypothetical protein